MVTMLPVSSVASAVPARAVAAAEMNNPYDRLDFDRGGVAVMSSSKAGAKNLDSNELSQIILRLFRLGYKAAERQALLLIAAAEPVPRSGHP
jgi:hypothetical protein